MTTLPADVDTLAKALVEDLARERAAVTALRTRVAVLAMATERVERRDLCERHRDLLAWAVDAAQCRDADDFQQSLDLVLWCVHRCD